LSSEECSRRENWISRRRWASYYHLAGCYSMWFGRWVDPVDVQFCWDSYLQEDPHNPRQACSIYTSPHMEHDFIAEQDVRIECLVLRSTLSQKTFLLWSSMQRL
jgi:hypothetical protein